VRPRALRTKVGPTCRNTSQQDTKYPSRRRKVRIKTEIRAASGKVVRAEPIAAVFEQGRIILPPSRYKTLYDRTTVDVIAMFVETELMGFPVAEHDDALDALARIADPDITLRWPQSDLEKALRGSQRPDSYLYKNRRETAPRQSLGPPACKNGRRLPA